MEQNFMNNVSGAQPSGFRHSNDYDAVQEMSATAQQKPYSRLDEGLKKIFGNDFSIDDEVSQEMLLQYLELNSKQNERLSQMLERDPRMAQMFADIANGKRNAPSAVARYFGRAYMDMEEGSPELEELLIADEERQEEVLRLNNDREEYENNLKNSKPVIEAFCKERGYDPAEFMDNVWEEIVFPIMSGRYTEEVCVALDHALTYEKDINDAFAAGDVKGRNTNIRLMKENFGDGLPKGISSVAPAAEPVRKRNSLIEKALNA